MPSYPSTPILEMGEGDRAVVFMHGLFSQPGHWLPTMNVLASRYRLIAPQLPVDRQPGRRSTGIRTIGELTGFLEELIESYELQKFVVVGNSLGGLVSIDYCLQNPGRVSGLVLAGSAGLYERNLTNGARPRPTKEFIRSMAKDIIYNQDLITDDLVTEWLEAARDRDFARFVLRISRATRDRCVEEQLHELDLPTLIIWGRNDLITPPSVAETFKRQIRDANLRYIEQCGHAPNLERPEIFAQMIEEFLPGCFDKPGSLSSRRNILH